MPTANPLPGDGAPPRDALPVANAAGPRFGPASVGPALVWNGPSANPAAWATWSIPRTSLVSRERELVLLRDLLTDEQVAMVTLTGPGGVGKTRLATQMAMDLRDEGRITAVAWVPLASIDSDDRVLPVIARSIGLSVELTDVADRIVTELSDRSVLIVLDNCEQVLGARPELARLLDRLPLLTILATSRSAFRLSVEREVAVSPLDSPANGSELTRETAADIPAIRLFVERAQAVDSRFALTDSNAPIVAAICERLDVCHWRSSSLPPAFATFPRLCCSAGSTGASRF